MGHPLTGGNAAKLLPSGCSVSGCPATGDGKPYAGVPTCMRGYAGDPAAYENYIRGCILRANTRPQPAPPAGEPDFIGRSPAAERYQMTVDPTADAAKLLPCPLSDDQIRYMVDRFLGWRLPKPWTPDNGISYARPNYMHAPADHDWPTGTNLFDWSQAEAMVRYMVEGLPTVY